MNPRFLFYCMGWYGVRNLKVICRTYQARFTFLASSKFKGLSKQGKHFPSPDHLLLNFLLPGIFFPSTTWPTFHYWNVTSLVASRHPNPPPSEKPHHLYSCKTVYTYGSIDHVILVVKEPVSRFIAVLLQSRDGMSLYPPNSLERAWHVVDAHNVY